jgi:hypothetical protein
MRMRSVVELIFLFNLPNVILQFAVLLNVVAPLKGLELAEFRSGKWTLHSMTWQLSAFNELASFNSKNEPTLNGQAYWEFW